MYLIIMHISNIFGYAGKMTTENAKSTDMMTRTSCRYSPVMFPSNSWNRPPFSASVKTALLVNACNIWRQKIAETFTRGLMCHHTWPHVPSHVASCAITRGLMCHHTWPHVPSHVASCAITRGLMCHHTWPHVPSHVASYVASCAVTRGLMCHHTWPHVPSHGASCAITRGLMCHQIG